MREITVLKIGGSLLSRSDAELFDFAYFHNLKKTILQLNAEGYSFLINVGGGYITRKYQKLAKDHGENDVIDVHRIGIALTNLNAQIFHGLFGPKVSPQILRYAAYDQFLESDNPRDVFRHYAVVIAGASQPGKSNDWNALQFALKLGSKRVIDVKDVDAVYTADPRKDPSAQMITALNWQEYLDVIGNPTEHKPGANYPVDPFAAKEADQKGIKYMVVGKDLENLAKCVRGEEFNGTTIG